MFKEKIVLSKTEESAFREYQFKLIKANSPSVAKYYKGQIETLITIGRNRAASGSN